MAGLERLGESDEWGETLIWLLRRGGWTVVRTRAFAGGEFVIARHQSTGRELRAAGERLAHAAYPVFRAAMELGLWRLAS